MAEETGEQEKRAFCYFKTKCVYNAVIQFQIMFVFSPHVAVWAARCTHLFVGGGIVAAHDVEMLLRIEKLVSPHHYKSTSMLSFVQEAVVKAAYILLVCADYNGKS